MTGISPLSVSVKALLTTVAIVVLDAIIVFLIVFFIRTDLVINVSRSDLDDMVDKAVSNINIHGGRIHYGADFSFIENNVYFLVLAEDGMVLSGRYPVNSSVEIGPPVEGYRSITLPVGEYYVIDKKIPGARGAASLWVRGVESASNANNINRILLLMLEIAMPIFAALAGVSSFFVARRAFTINLRREKRFTADVSHELRTPVSVILAQSEYLLGYSEDKDEWREGMEEVRVQSVKMKEMTESLLMLSRMEQGSSKVEKEILNLFKILELAEADIKNLHPDMEVSKEVAKDITLYGNKTLLSRVFINLLENTYKYGEKSAQITAETGYKKIVITYTDKGSFSDKKAVRHIFDPFYRTDAARTSGGGFGLGLALVHRIISTHGGRITAKIKPGGGIIFKIILRHKSFKIPVALI